MKIAIPQLIFGSLAAGLIGSVIHLVLGGKLLRLVFSLVFSWIGFWAGHAIANRYSFFYFRFGTINFGAAFFGAVVIGLFGFWIAGENKIDKDNVE
jgi:hypothetical protein